jgi:hypothetical protein
VTRRNLPLINPSIFEFLKDDELVLPRRYLLHIQYGELPAFQKALRFPRDRAKVLATMSKGAFVAVIAVVCIGSFGCATKPSTTRTVALKASVTAPTLHCKSVNGLPDHTCTPGAVRTTSVQSICHGGSTKQWRPPSSYTDALKVQQIA